MKRFTPIITSLFLSTASLATAADPMSLTGSKVDVTVNNRVLAQVNGKAITVIDVMKKMDMIFYKHYSEYATVPQARYQFYQANWKPFLQEIISKELVLAEAQELNMPVTKGDVRQEMQQIFAPNIIATLDGMGMTYEEAFEIVKGDIILKRMMYVRVNAKALKQITPQLLKKTYEEYAEKNIRPNKWQYQVISVRGKDSIANANIAKETYFLLNDGDASVENVVDQMQKRDLLSEQTKLTVSTLFDHTDQEASGEYLQVLFGLAPGEFSAPVEQKSRSDNSTVYRIFYLKDKQQGGLIPFKEVESKLSNSLMEKFIDEESKNYFVKLRQHFDVIDTTSDNSLADDYQPFALK